MKQLFIIIVLAIASLGAFSQTATNFTCNDCNGVSHNLFDELDAGKVIVLCWVMPCATCVGPTKTTYNVVQSFNLTHPDRVKMYICDDYANTSCSSLNSWCVQNGVTNSTRFSNSSIKMTDYGSVGMPKIVVVGNYSHHVYYNANSSVNPTLLNAAINNALNDFFVGVSDPVENGIKCFPNPVTDQVSISFNAEKSGTCKLTLYNNTAIQVSQSRSSDIIQGENIITFNTKDLKNGIYFAHLQTDSGMMRTKFVVSH